MFGYFTMPVCPPLFTTVMRVAFPAFHVMSTVKLPTAFKPVMWPVFQAAGRAGSTWRVSVWLCSNISAMPEQAPKLPSIWNGACES